MSARHVQVLDAAITVLGTSGIRHLTHRAVDTTAGLPAGSTSNYFRTREALLTAVIERFATRDRETWETIANVTRPDTPDKLARALAAYVVQATGPDRHLTLARYGLFVEVALRPELQRQLGETTIRIREWGARWLGALGSTDPEGDCQLVLNHLDGLMLHRLAFPDYGGDPYPELARLVNTVTSR